VLPLPWIMEQVTVLGKGLLCRMKINFVEQPETMMNDFRESRDLRAVRTKGCGNPSPPTWRASRDRTFRSQRSSSPPHAVS